jgi:flavorubredoxin
MNTELCDGIDWIGYIDWTVRDFHSYVTRRGATYNAYLVRDEKTALIDTVKSPYAADLLRNIAALTPLDAVDYIVVNHAEPDHASGLAQVLAACPNATIVCDEKCREILLAYNEAAEGWPFKIVATGDTLPLGTRSLAFVETPMVHWPDSMATYCPEEKILFCMDAFGQHYASAARFDDEVDLCKVMEEAKTYYANIVMCFGKPIRRALEAAGQIEIEMLAPAHGVIWRSHPGRILEAYDRWTQFIPRPKVLVAYDTMWQSTAQMARAILEGASLEGVEAKLVSIRDSSLTEIVTDVLDAACIAFGSSTLNRGMMPMMGALLTYLEGLRPENKAAMAFGSFGWSKGGPEAIQEWIGRSKLDAFRDEPLRAKWRPGADDLAACREAGEALGHEALKRAGLGPQTNASEQP